MNAIAPRLALVDCNNFYVSCERAFRPDLRDQPVAVLSNNDGCIVARSEEVKALGIKMGTPVYQVRELIDRHRIQLFSSNYALYADMSRRVMQCLEAFTPRLEVYSIDESFLDLDGLGETAAAACGLQIKRSVQRATGIPVCIGMGPTKTLAKLANHAAKRWPGSGGVVDLSCPDRRERLLRRVPAGAVWGIGAKTAQRLQSQGIHSAHDLARQTPARIQARFNIVVARIVLELNGTACLSLEEVAPPRQQIVCSRSFRQRLSDYRDLADALAGFCARAAEKLRRQHSLAGSLTVFIRTNPFNPSEPCYQRAAYARLLPATQDSRRIIATAKQLLEAIYKPGYRYQKCGVQLDQLQPAAAPGPVDLFAPAEPADSDKSRQLMNAVDRINRRFPKGIAVSTAGIQPSWPFPVEHLSQRYTTHWHELARVKCR